MTAATVKCYGCRRRIKFHKTGAGLQSDGKIAINLPGVVCPDCIFEVLDRVPDPPGLTCCEIFPDQRRFRAYVGDALFFQDRIEEAFAEYEKAIALPDSNEKFEISLKRMMEECRKRIEPEAH
jgi:hypothetical protein